MWRGAKWATVRFWGPQCVSDALIGGFLPFSPFALAGLVLVAAIIFLNTTVSIGTINGLVFYANIVQANQAIFFPEKSITSVIMSWLNLDVGIKVCSFDGMDAYVKTWLQPVFPIYIWTMVVVILYIQPLFNKGC